jgi:hypothetical protein
MPTDQSTDSPRSDRRARVSCKAGGPQRAHVASNAWVALLATNEQTNKRTNKPVSVPPAAAARAAVGSRNSHSHSSAAGLCACLFACLIACHPFVCLCAAAQWRTSERSPSLRSIGRRSASPQSAVNRSRSQVAVRSRSRSPQSKPTQCAVAVAAQRSTLMGPVRRRLRMSKPAPAQRRRSAGGSTESAYTLRPQQLLEPVHEGY